MTAYNVVTRREGWRHVWTVLVESDDTLTTALSGRALTDRGAYRKAHAAVRRHHEAHR